MKPLKTFWELISGEYPDSVLPDERDEEYFIINIPIIQRDYAQGRETEKQRRDLFLEELFNHININGKKPLHLEFIYGRVKEDKIKDENQKEISVFSPIDGQQRLTTLYLLHWYIGLKEKIKEKKPESFKKLKNFIYDTRISSRDFCKALIEEDIVISGAAKEDIVEKITSSYWFRTTWNNDPTIKAMLIMIQAIHAMFFNTDGVWLKLTEERLITFHILDMGKEGFKLNDELYIKMNSRGKPLTPFETLKANFIKFLETEYNDKYLGEDSYSDYFSFRIEKQWTDLIWTYRDEGVFIIDEYFMNYFSFISQLLYFMDYSGEDVRAGDFDVNNYKQMIDIYSNKKPPFICHNNVNIDRVAFLFKSLDLFYNISLIDDKVDRKRLNNFFMELFYSSDPENEKNDNMKIKVDDEGKIFLFERCLKNNINIKNNNFQIKDRIILFSIIFYCLKFNLIEFSEKDYKNITHCVRVIRNLLSAQRREKNLRFDTDLSIDNFSAYWRLFKELLEPEIYKLLPSGNFTKSTDRITEQLNKEKEKAELINSQKDENQRAEIQRVLFMLEDFRYFDGLIHVLNVKKNKDKLNEYLEAIEEIWSNDDPLIIQAMIATGFEGYYVKDIGGADAEAVYFGSKKGWDWILTNEKEEEEITKYIFNLLDIYIEKKLPKEEKLNKIISEAKKNYERNNWKYYFLKYPEMFKKSDYYYFALYDYSFNIMQLYSTKVSPLRAKHINAYVRVICNNDEVKKYCKSESDCRFQYGEEKPLILENGLKLFCENEWWRLDINKMDPGPDTVFQSVMGKYGISDKDYILRDYKDLDRIQTVIEFIKDIYAGK